MSGYLISLTLLCLAVTRRPAGTTNSPSTPFSNIKSSDLTPANVKGRSLTVDRLC